MESFGNNLYNRNCQLSHQLQPNWKSNFFLHLVLHLQLVHIKNVNPPHQHKHVQKIMQMIELKLKHPHVALHKMCPTINNGLMNWNATSRKPRPRCGIFHIHAHWLKTFCSGDRWHMVKYHNWRLPLFSKDAVLKTSLLAIVGYLWIMYR